MIGKWNEEAVQVKWKGMSNTIEKAVHTALHSNAQ